MLLVERAAHVRRAYGLSRYAAAMSAFRLGSPLRLDHIRSKAEAESRSAVIHIKADKAG
jgi:hypothetical protein